MAAGCWPQEAQKEARIEAQALTEKLQAVELHVKQLEVSRAPHLFARKRRGRQHVASDARALHRPDRKGWVVDALECRAQQQTQRRGWRASSQQRMRCVGAVRIMGSYGCNG